MIQYLEFAFTSVWHFLGCVVILQIIVSGVTQVLGKLAEVLLRKPDVTIVEDHRKG